MTLIENLEHFGIVPAELSHEIQIGIACSCTVNALPAKNKGLQVTIQGNQTKYVHKLLTGNFFHNFIPDVIAFKF